MSGHGGRTKQHTKIGERKMNENNKKPVSMKIDADVWRIFKACAVSNNYKVAELVEKALIDEVKMMEVKENA